VSRCGELVSYGTEQLCGTRIVVATIKQQFNALFICLIISQEAIPNGSSGIRTLIKQIKTTAKSRRNENKK